MKERITAHDMTEKAVIVLLKGIKSKVAVKDKDGNLILKNRSILMQFLTPNYSKNPPLRTKMTKRIADALTTTFEYYLTCNKEDHFNICARAILFIYTISSVDLTSFINHEKELLQLVDALFHAFQGKESVERSKLQSLVYEYAFDSNWHIETTPATISYVDYENIFSNNLLFYIAKDQLNSLKIDTFNEYKKSYDCDSDDITFEEYHKEQINYIFKNYNNLYKFEEDMTYEQYCEKLRNSSCRSYEWLDKFFQFLDDLIKSDCLDNFKKQYPKLNYQYYIDKVINDADDDWKKFVLEVNFPIFNLYDNMKPLFTELCFTNLYHITHPYLNYFCNRIRYFEANCLSREKRHLSSNENLINCQTFQILKRTLASYTSYLQLQIRVNTELGTFGSCHNQMNSVRQNIPDIRSFVGIMIEYLFYGTKSKIGKITNDEKFDFAQKIMESQSDTIFKYINKQQEHFTSVVKDAIYLRIDYHLFPEKRVKDGNAKLSPEQFIDQLWQLFFYVFGIDFYMLRKDDETTKKYWCKILSALFSEMIKTSGMSTLQRITEKYYVQYQILSEGKTPSRFTPEEIDFFREQETIAHNDFNQLVRKTVIEPNNYEALNAASEYIISYANSKAASLLEKVEKTIEYISNILTSNTHDDLIKRHDSFSFSLDKVINNNWECNIYALKRESAINRFVINDIELNDLLHQIRILTVKPSLDKNILSYVSSLKDRLWNYIKFFSEKEDDYYFLSFPDHTKKEKKEKEKNVNVLDKQFIDCEPVQQLYSTLRKAYKFILYREWIWSNLIVT